MNAPVLFGEKVLRWRLPLPIADQHDGFDALEWTSPKPFKTCAYWMAGMTVRHVVAVPLLVTEPR